MLKRLEFAMNEFAAHYSKTTNPAAVGMVHVIPFRKATGEMIFKVGKSSFELRKSDTTRIPLVRCLERYRSIMLQGDLQCVGMPFLFLTSSSGRAQDIEGHLHTYMKMEHVQEQDVSTSFGGRKNGGLCEIYRETAKDVILDMLRRTSMLSQLQMNEAR